VIHPLPGEELDLLPRVLSSLTPAPPLTILRGCGKKVTITVSPPILAASSRSCSRICAWPVWTPSKVPIVIDCFMEERKLIDMIIDTHGDVNVLLL
jgi:hypothetical protein